MFGIFKRKKHFTALKDKAALNDDRSAKLEQSKQNLNREQKQPQAGVAQQSVQPNERHNMTAQPKIPELYPFTQWFAYGDPMYGIASNELVVEFVGEKTGRRTAIIDEKRAIQNFPGIENEEKIREMLGEGSLMPYNSFGVEFRTMGDDRYQMIWEVQPDGQMFWQDEYGFGGTSDAEIKLSAIIDQQGRFATPFVLYSVNGIKQ